MNLIDKLQQVHDELAEANDGFAIVDAWSLASRLLTRVPVDQAEAAQICETKDLAGFQRLLDSLREPGDAPEPKPDPQSFAHDDLAAAVRAFKKRLKLSKLNDESRLGGRYTSGGRSSAIAAIQPPSGFDPAIWPALVREGRLVDRGNGFYGLPAAERA
ncbi:MAG: hypothetical protein AAGB48_12760 [Planctomycetota bacterium]